MAVLVPVRLGRIKAPVSLTISPVCTVRWSVHSGRFEPSRLRSREVGAMNLPYSATPHHSSNGKRITTDTNELENKRQHNGKV
jgi:hypothetical protein